MSSPNREVLQASLVATREALERWILDLCAIRARRDWTVSEEKQHRYAVRSLREVIQEFLPWIRLPSMSELKGVDITYRLNVMWTRIPAKYHPSE